MQESIEDSTSKESEPKSFMESLRRNIGIVEEDIRSGRNAFARELPVYVILLKYLPLDFDIDLPEDTINEVYKLISSKARGENTNGPESVAMEIATFLMLRRINEKR